MSISDKIKTINNKIEEKKAQYDFDRQTTKIPALSSGNVSKYKCLTGRGVLPEKKLVRKKCWIEKTWIFSVRQWIKSTN